MANYTKKAMTSNVARDIKLYDLILSFLLFSRTNIGSKTFHSLWKVLVLCDFLNLICLRIIATSLQS